jgi:hypothetical protein
MNCQRFDEIVSDLSQERMMEADVRIDAQAHADECAPCQARLLDHEALTRWLQSLATDMKIAEPSPSLEFKLRDAFRARQNPVVARTAHSYRRYWLTAAAAVLLMVFSVLVWNWKRDMKAPVVVAEHNESSKETQPQVVHPLVERQQLPSAKLENGTGRRRRNARLVQLSKHRIEPRTTSDGNMVAANNSPREIATEFIPIGYMSSASLQDGGQIVRVELPRSALASFGLPVNMDRYNEKVKADVVLGVDGLAHAIRFVQ